MADFPLPDPGASPIPRFWKMDSTQFERFCLALGRKVFSDVDDGDLFENKGVAQFGCDFYLNLKNGNKIVGSCKAHEKPVKKDIVGAAEEFIKYWDSKWKNQNVEKYVLCLAANARSQIRQKHIKTVKAKIQKLGIACEVWSQKSLIEFCRPHTGIVRHFLSDVWVEVLCDIQLPDISGPSQLMFDTMIEKTESLLGSVHPLLKSQLEEINRLKLDGITSAAAELAEQIHKDSNLWNVCEATQKAELLRIIGLSCLIENPETSKEHFDKAEKIFPSDNRYFEGLYLLHSGDPDGALRHLEDSEHAKDITLKIAIFMEKSEFETARRLLNEIEDLDQDYERLRLLSLCEAFMGDLPSALEKIEAAFLLGPNVWSIRYSRAVILLSSALAPVADFLGLHWPEPVPSDFVKSDDQSQTNIRLAADEFKALRELTPKLATKAKMDVWQFAARVLDSTGRTAAQEILDNALQKGNLHPGIIFWALSRRFSFDQIKAKRLLQKLADSDENPKVEAVIVLVSLLCDQGKQDHANEVLETYRDDLDNFNAELVPVWRDRIANSVATVTSSNRTIGEYVESLEDSDNPAFERLYAAFELAQSNEWEVISKHDDFLVNHIATFEAMRLSIITQINVGGEDKAISYIDDYLYHTSDPNEKHELARLRVEALAKKGEHNLALEYARQSFLDPKHRNYLVRAHLAVQSGNLIEAGHDVKMAFAAGNEALNNPMELVRWAHTLKLEDRETAKQLLKRASELDLEKIAPAALGLAFNLLPSDASPFMAVMSRRASDPESTDAAHHTLDEVRDIMIADRERAEQHYQLYRDGKIYAHAIYRDRLGAHLLGNDTDDLQQPWRYIENASRHDAPKCEFDTLLIDVTALLLAQRLNLVSDVIGSNLKIIIPHDWAATLLEFEDKCRPQQPDRYDAQTKLVDLVNSGQIRLVKTPTLGAKRLVYDDQDEELGSAEIRLSHLTHLMKTEDDFDVVLKSLVPSGKLIAEASVIQTLILEKLYDKVCATTAIEVDASGYNFFTSEHEALNVQITIADEIEKLRALLAKSIRLNQISVTPQVTMDMGDDREMERAESSVWSILKFKAPQNCAAWIEDRYLNSHANIDAMPIIGIRDVLEKLESGSYITQTKSRKTIKKLRQLNYLFLLPTAEECAEAVLSNGVDLDEKSKTLRVLKKTLAQFGVHHGDIFKTEDQSRVSEKPAVIYHMSLLAQTLNHLVQKSRQNNEDLVHASLWAYDNVGVRFIYDSPTQNEAANDNLIHVHTLSTMFITFLDPDILSDEKLRDRATILLDGIFINRIKQQFVLSKGLKKLVCGNILGHLKNFISFDEEGEKYRIALVRAFLTLLPKEISNFLQDDVPFNAQIITQSVVQIENIVIPEAEFWNAIEQAKSSGKKCTINDEDSESIDLYLNENGAFVLSKGDEEKLLKLNVQKMLRGYENNLVKACSYFSDLIGLDKVQQQRLLDYFSDHEGFEQRESYIRNILANTYSGKSYIISNFKSGQKIDILDLAPPEIEGFLERLGLSDLKTRNIELAFRKIAEELGFEAAIARWLGYPLVLPSEFVDWVSRLSGNDAQEFIGRLAAGAASPISVSNLISIANIRSDCTELSDEFIECLFENLAIQIQQTTTLASAAFGYYLSKGTKIEHLESLALLSWVWADQLFSDMNCTKYKMDELIDFFRERTKPGVVGLQNLMAFKSKMDPVRISEEFICMSIVSNLPPHIFDKLKVEDISSIREIVCLGPNLEEVHPYIIADCAIPNDEVNWFRIDPERLLNLVPNCSTFSRDAVLEPDAVITKMLEARYPDMIAFSVLNLSSLSNGQIRRLFKHIRSSIQRMKAGYLFTLSFTLYKLPKLDSALHVIRQKLFLDIVSRNSLIESDDEERKKLFLHTLEHVYMSEMSQSGENWAEPVAQQYRKIANLIKLDLRAEMVLNLRLLIDSLPVAKKQPLEELRMEIVAAG